MQLSLFSLFFLVSSKSCYRYKCDENQDSCAVFSNDIIYANKDYCDVDEYCKLSSDSDAYCAKIYYEDLLPGRKCKTESQCYTFSCSNNICDGVQEGKSCSYSSSCDIGLYCHEINGVCTKLLSLGDACEYSSECDYQYTCLKGVCIEMFSIETGESIPSISCSESFSDACVSAQCYSDDSHTVCVDPYEYDGGDIVTCESDSSCISKSADYTKQYECLCGINSYGTSYCTVTLGSSYGKKYHNLVKNLIKSDIRRKSHRREYLLNVIKDWGDDADLETYIWFYYGEQIFGGLDCAVDMRLYILYYEGETSLGLILKLGLAFLAYF